MAPGTKRIAFGGVALAVVAWIAIDLYLPDPQPPGPAPHRDEGLPPIPEKTAGKAIAAPMPADACGAASGSMKGTASGAVNTSATTPATTARPLNADACTTAEP